MNLYFVRHTSVVTDGNTYCYGASDVAVRSTFFEEADQVKASLEGVTPDLVLSSPLSRAMLLARYCYRQQYPISPDDRLREISFGKWELHPWKDIIKGADEVDFFKHYIRHRTPEGESLYDVKLRLYRLLQELASDPRKPRNVVLFCHGGIIGCAHSIFSGIEPQSIFSTLVPFGAVAHFEMNALPEWVE